ncbi:ABC transporter permease [Bellilinea sp.]|uniref:ABC transporter permease n=1 Tax=Bellilinea sp. TaxID=2838785 RepID=UPI002ADD46B6|nr:ABC transporter permease [Bellilinea sp.]
MVAQVESITLSNDYPKEESPWKLVFRRFRKHKLAMISLGVMVILFLITLFARQITPFEVDEITVGNYFLKPGSVQEATGRVHLLGTDHLGRDLFSRLIYAGRISLTVALLSVLISSVIGVTIGAISGYYGGWVDNLLMRIVEFFLTIPSLPILLIISAMLLKNQDAIPIPKYFLELAGKLMLLEVREARQAVLIVLVLAGLGWLTSAQLMRGMVLSLRNQTFVEAAKAMGAGGGWIIFRHMIPNAMAPIIVDASLNMANYVVAEAALSFLGFGIQEPIPTWGNMLSATQAYMLNMPWLPLIPGLPIFLCSLAFNYIGDGLRDALDPRLKL